MKDIRTEKIVLGIINTFICIVAVAIVLFPFLWSFLGALKTNKELYDVLEVYGKYSFFPKDPQWKNFIEIFNFSFNEYNFVRSLGYTLLVSTIAVILNLSFNMTAAYAFARIEFRGKKALWVIAIGTMFVPGIAILLTSVRLVNLLGLVDTLWAIILPGICNGYMIFFFRQFFLGIPMSLEDAASLDGCNRIQTFIYVFIPMSTAPMVIQGMGCFMANWNSFMWPTLTITNNPEITQVMQIIKLAWANYSNTKAPIVLAAIFIAALVPVSLFAIFQKQIIGGIAISGLK